MSVRTIPNNATEMKDTESDAVAYVYNYDGYPAVIIFFGRRSKAAAHMRFATEKEREDYIIQYFQIRRSHQAYKKSKQGAHSMNVGDIMVSSWGWEQTNVDFYQVVKTTGSFVYVRHIKSKTTPTGDMRGTAVAIKDSFDNEDAPLRFKCGQDNTIKIESYARATKWDGAPQNWTAYA